MDIRAARDQATSIRKHIENRRQEGLVSETGTVLTVGERVVSRVRPGRRSRRPIREFEWRRRTQIAGMVLNLKKTTSASRCSGQFARSVRRHGPPAPARSSRSRSRGLLAASSPRGLQTMAARRCSQEPPQSRSRRPHHRPHVGSRADATGMKAIDLDDPDRPRPARADPWPTAAPADGDRDRYDHNRRAEHVVCFYVPSPEQSQWHRRRPADQAARWIHTV